MQPRLHAAPRPGSFAASWTTPADDQCLKPDSFAAPPAVGGLSLALSLALSILLCFTCNLVSLPVVTYGFCPVFF